MSALSELLRQLNDKHHVKTQTQKEKLNSQLERIFPAGELYYEVKNEYIDVIYVNMPLKNQVIRNSSVAFSWAHSRNQMSRKKLKDIQQALGGSIKETVVTISYEDWRKVAPLGKTKPKIAKVDVKKFILSIPLENERASKQDKWHVEMENTFGDLIEKLVYPKVELKGGMRLEVNYLGELHVDYMPKPWSVQEMKEFAKLLAKSRL